MSEVLRCGAPPTREAGVGGTSRMLALCGGCDRIETKSNATGETMLALGRERMKLRGVRVPQ
jgi:hypothetical protein